MAIDCKSLMIGDWVYNKHHEKPIKITQYDFFTHGHRKNGEQYLNANPIPTLGRDLEPIPLTPEILENNGFFCYGAWAIPGEDIGIRQDGDEWGILPHYGLYTSFAFCHIKFVHELQHALKLCQIEKEIVL